MNPFFFWESGVGFITRNIYGLGWNTRYFLTRLCWDPKDKELNELSQFYFDLLRKAEILHDTPETLALKLNEIYEDPMS